jgi:hypothetical protein
MWLSEARVCCRKGPIVRSFVSKFAIFYLASHKKVFQCGWMDDMCVHTTHTHTLTLVKGSGRDDCQLEKSRKKKDFLLFSSHGQKKETMSEEMFVRQKYDF